MNEKTTAALYTRLRYRRLELDNGAWRYRWDWYVPDTEHESGKLYASRLGAQWSAWWFRRAVLRADEIGVGEPRTLRLPQARPREAA